MSHLMIEVQRGEQVARLVPVADVKLTSGAKDRLAALHAADNGARNAGTLAAVPCCPAA
jgi:hypothetical protein